MLKSLRFIPLFVMILSGYAFADEQGNPSSDTDAINRAAVQAAAAKAAAAKAAAAKAAADLHGHLRSEVIKPDSVLSSYVTLIRNIIQNNFADSLDIYKGKSCTIKVGLSRDGTVLYAVDYGGDAGLCNTVALSIRNIEKFPSPPSEQIYQKMKDFKLDFKP